MWTMSIKDLVNKRDDVVEAALDDAMAMLDEPNTAEDFQRVVASILYLHGIVVELERNASIPEFRKELAEAIADSKKAKGVAGLLEQAKKPDPGPGSVNN